MPKQPNPALAARLRTATPKVNPDKLKQLQAMGAQARDLEFEILSLEEQLKEKKSALQELYQNKIPTLMDVAGVDAIGIPPAGNLPGTDYKLRDYYSASIAAKWPEEKKEEAYAVLKAHKAESLIKAEVTAKLPKGKLAIAKKLIKAAHDLKIDADLKISVHAGTLSAWLRELYDDGQQLTTAELKKLGASVGRTVQPKERKE